MRAFGPFSEVRLDLSGGAPGGLHVIYGPNEAGKSTSLRAVRALLYGIPSRTPDAHTHPNAALSLEAEITHDAERLRFIRYKRVKNSLVTPDGAPLAEARLAEALGYLDEQSFVTRFGLDQVELERGAEALLGGRESGLFAAGTAGVDVRELLNELSTSREALFTRRGRIKPLNHAADRYREAARSLAGLVRPPESYMEQAAARDVWKAQLERLRARRREVLQEHGHLTRLASMHSQFRELAAAERELEELGRVLPLGRPLVHDAVERRTNAERDARDAEVGLAKLRPEIARLDQEISRLIEDKPRAARERLLKLEGPIHALGERVGATRRARADLPRLKARQVAALAQVAHLASGGGVVIAGVNEARDGRASPTFLRAVQAALPSANVKKRLRELALELGRLDAERVGFEERTFELEQEVRSATQRLEALPQEIETKSIEMRLGEVRATVALEERWETLRLELLDQTRALNALRERTGCSSSAAELQRGLLGSRELEALELRLEQTLHEGTELRKEGLRFERELDQVKAEFDALAEGREVENDEALEGHRRARDRYLEDLSSHTQRVGFPAAQAELRALVERADAVVDRLRTDAERWARLDGLQGRARQLLHELERVHARQESLDKETRLEQESLLERLRVFGCPPKGQESFAASIDWLHDLVALREVALRKNALSDEQTRVTEAVRNARAVLLDAVGDEQMEGRSLRALLEQVEAILRRRTNLRDLRREEERRRDEAKSKVAELRVRATRLEERTSELKRQFEIAGSQLGSGKTLGVADALEVLSAAEAMIAPFTEANEKEQRIAGILRDAEALEEEIMGLARRVEFVSDTSDPLEVADALSAELGRARRDALELERLNSTRHEYMAEAEKLERAHQLSARVIADLLDAGGVHSLAELRELEMTSQRCEALLERRAFLVGALKDKADTSSLEALATEAARSDHRQLTARSEELSDELESLNEEISRAEAELGGKELVLARFHTTDAVEARQLCATRFDEARELLHRYLVLRTAQELLGREVHRYAERFAGPLTERASELFRRLTLDRYAGLRASWSSDTLMCLTRAGREKEVGELSKGTRAQLYLALRLASLEAYFRRHPKVPLVFDDLFVDFDDERASAAFEILGELAGEIQILYFTHLARDLERAEDSVQNGRLFEHRIGLEV